MHLFLLDMKRAADVAGVQLISARDSLTDPAGDVSCGRSFLFGMPRGKFGILSQGFRLLNHP